MTLPESDPYRLIRDRNAISRLAPGAAAALAKMGIVGAQEAYVYSLHPDAADIAHPVRTDLALRAEDLKSGSVDQSTVQIWVGQAAEIALRTIFTVSRN